MTNAFFLFSEDIPELITGSAPESLSKIHPLWNMSLHEWGPWSDKGALITKQVTDGESHKTLKGWINTDKTITASTFLCAACSSALDVAWQMMRWNVLREWDAVIAVQQWAGRGQVRRPWQSLPGNLHVAWRTPAMPAHWDGLTSLVPAWITARTLSHFGFDLCLKWPNDLLWNGKKVGGILAEQRGSDVLIGLGLNLAQVPDPADIRQGGTLQAGSLNGGIRPITCWNQLVSNSRHWYTKILPEVRPEDFSKNFSELLAWKDERITILDHSHNQAIQGRLLGISADGSLVVSIKGNVQRVYTGEIQLLA
jgi:BirA family transcriptional regulator, biotin operon repressor / biotin---[acetyl-CoA-carboxylase] ligase